MEHIAIMRKQWGLLGRILAGEKTIESRWYLNRYRPWNAVKKGDRIYFKNSGEPVTVRARITRVVQCAELTPGKVSSLLKTYGKRDGVRPDEMRDYYERFKKKNYAIFISLERVRKVKPFEITKQGFGAMAAWMTVRSVKKLKVK